MAAIVRHNKTYARKRTGAQVMDAYQQRNSWDTAKLQAAMDAASVGDTAAAVAAMVKRGAALVKAMESVKSKGNGIVSRSNSLIARRAEAKISFDQVLIVSRTHLSLLHLSLT
jgi:hypothetical protein